MCGFFAALRMTAGLVLRMIAWIAPRNLTGYGLTITTTVTVCGATGVPVSVSCSVSVAWKVPGERLVVSHEMVMKAAPPGGTLVPPVVSTESHAMGEGFETVSDQFSGAEPVFVSVSICVETLICCETL